MSCGARLVVVADDPDPLADHAELRLVELEQRWSRFLADSEISGLNRAGGEPRRCSGDTVLLVDALVRAWHATGGAFDPTLLGTLVELGYAASRTDATVRTSISPGVAGRGRPDQILVDRHTGVVQLPEGTTLDPGGIGKGLAADLIVDDLLRSGASGVLVEIGGDIRVGGIPPEGDHWLVAVAPTPVDEPVHVALKSGGIATSTSRLRTWTTAEGWNHHLIDPNTLAPTDGDVIACTVVAGDATWAEAFTKTAFVNGCSDALALLTGRHLAARITTDDGRHHHTPAWEVFAR